MTNAAITIHNNISQEGIEVDSDEYYNEVNSRLKRYFPESFGKLMTSQKKRHRNPSKRLPRLVVANKDAEL
jgi:hypothetical protein